MVKLLKSASFRSVHAAGVYAVEGKTELRLMFVDIEPIGGETEPGPQANIQELPHLQVEVIMERPIAKWIRDYLDAYLKEPEAPKQ